MNHTNYRGSEIKDLIGKTLVSVTRGDAEDCGDFIDFTTAEGQRFRMYHAQDCCESVTIEDICGDLKDLECKIIDASEESNCEDTDKYGSETWTFYKIQSERGSVTIRWYGESNGYYSEEVDFVEVLD